MKISFYKKITAVLIAVIFCISAVPCLYAVEIKVNIPFGHGSDPKKNDTIGKLKNEDTQGAWTGIGLILLGAAIVVAAVLVVNKVDDVTDKAGDSVDNIKQEIKDEINKPNPEPTPTPTPAP